jgi:hypothetical protein
MPRCRCAFWTWRVAGPGEVPNDEGTRESGEPPRFEYRGKTQQQVDRRGAAIAGVDPASPDEQNRPEDISRRAVKEARRPPGSSPPLTASHACEKPN